ncbi:hypothetical protein BO94DRAFT_494431, partial [Aspergillus sclerotioniger CBS 115572]
PPLLPPSIPVTTKRRLPWVLSLEQIFLTFFILFYHSFLFPSKSPPPYFSSSFALVSASIRVVPGS